MAANKVINGDKTHIFVIGPKSYTNKISEVKLQAGTEKLLGGHISQDLKYCSA